ncbi:protein kinase domain-containing protein [Microbacterium sp. PRC9]|uniref:serine/threonine-protein kinase n=1 Tax=Microbacterium sp. PRC9 TaxID=2962591 RepID=UPI0028814E06|nr:protein kinase [Microbacterium sp. PRC9]MDT0142356.1 protein kinase [Microbacterium sp. PRC9]
MAEANADDTAPLIDGRYRLGDLVGEGGMARVYRAEDVLLGRTVAIKLIRPGIDGASSERARSEMTVLASLNHPSLVTLFDASLVPGQPEYLAMEFVDGPTLGARLASGGPLPPHIVGHLGAELAEALHVVHKAGVVHRDIKPSNVLLSPPQIPGARPRAKLADFGIAYLLDTSRITSPGLVIGTVAYLAPEQLRGDPPTPAADIYSLGLVFLEALTGERVHPQGGGMAAAVARLESRPEIPASLDEPWIELLTRMLHPDPSQRPTAAEVAAATGSLAQHTPAAGSFAATTGATVPFTAPTLIAPAGGVIAASSGRAEAAALAPDAAGNKARRKRLMATLAGALAAVAVLVGAVAGIAALNQPEPAPAPVVTTPAAPDPSDSPPAEVNTGTGGGEDSGVTEEERKQAEREQRKQAQEEEKRLREEQREDDDD